MTTSLPESQRTYLPAANSTRSTKKKISPEREDWITQATCRQGDPDALFVRGAKQRTAAMACRRCPALDSCLATALDNREEFGVWGGLTERQRRSILRKNSHVENWASYLSAGGAIEGI